MKEENESLEQFESSPDHLDLKPQRISGKHMLEVTMGILNFDRGVLYTIRELIIRPGKSVNRYLFKDRSKFVHPLRFLFLSAAIAAFLNTQFVFTEGTFSQSFQEGIHVNADEEQAQDADIEAEQINGETDTAEGASTQEKPEIVHTEKGDFTTKELQAAIANYIIGIINQFFSLFLILYVPIGALLTRLFFRKNKMYFGEHLAINAFLIGMLNVTYILVIPFVLFTDSSTPFVAYIILMGIYQLVFYTKVFQRSWSNGMLRAVIASFISVILYMIVIFGFLALFLNHFIDSYGLASSPAQ